MRCSLALVFCLYFSIPICLLGTKNFSSEYFQQQVNFDIKVELDVDKKYPSKKLEEARFIQRIRILETI